MGEHFQSRKRIQTRVDSSSTVVPDGLLQRRSTNRIEPSTAPPIVHEVLRSTGQPLDPATQAFFEPRFGHDFSRVRVHTGARAGKSARAVNALAYTVGRDVVFGAGHYSPETTEGRRLLAHELTHVVQQSARASAMVNRLHISRFDQAHEHEADRIAESVTQGQSAFERAWLNCEVQVQRRYTACLETAVEEFRRSPVCTPPSRVVSPGQDPKKVCGVFPGGSTDCEVDEESGEITGKVTMEVGEVNPCVNPCVRLHEKVHERQMLPLCRELKECWEAADTGERPATDCWNLALRKGGPENECEAYQASIICLEERLATAPECADPHNFEYAWDVLEGEKCYQDHYCREAAASRTRHRSSVRSRGGSTRSRE